MRRVPTCESKQQCTPSRGHRGSVLGVGSHRGCGKAASLGRPVGGGRGIQMNVMDEEKTCRLKEVPGLILSILKGIRETDEDEECLIKTCRKTT